MLDWWGKHGRGAAIALSAILAAAALAAVLVTVATARPLDFLHIRTNLSHTATRFSAGPDLATSPDGSRVAVVWTEGYTATVSRGHVYLRVASEAGAGWSDKTSVFHSDRFAQAYDAAVAVTGTTAHVAYVVSRFGYDGALSQMDVLYKRCDLSPSQALCDASPEELVASVDASRETITWVDLTLDANENPHVVWVQYDASRQGDIHYCARDVISGWGSIEAVASAGDNNRPAIAWADGYAHVVWEEDAAHRILYWQRAESGQTISKALCLTQTLSPPSSPDVAAGLGRVFVVWERCADLDGSVCHTYNLAYRRSNDGGSDWGEKIREIGTDQETFSREYGSVSVSLEVPDFLKYLKPSIALNGDGWPAVVWHAESPNDPSGTEYVIYHSYASSGDPEDGLKWKVNTPSTLFTGTLGSAVIGVGRGDSSPVLHVAFMQQMSAEGWDIFYGSNEEDRYLHVYLPLVAKGYGGPTAASCAAASGRCGVR